MLAGVFLISQTAGATVVCSPCRSTAVPCRVSLQFFFAKPTLPSDGDSYRADHHVGKAGDTQILVILERLVQLSCWDGCSFSTRPLF